MGGHVNTHDSGQTDLLFVHSPEIIREIYVSALAQEGHAVVAFDSVADARVWIDAHPDAGQAVIMELRPEPEDAWSLIDDLHERRPGLAIIVLTSSVRPDRANRARARMAGVAAFIGKPCGIRQLADVVIRVLAGERGLEVLHYAEA